MEQRSKEWFAARMGKITASRMGDVLANPKTKRYKNYLLEKVNELSGAPPMNDSAPWFAHGLELEPVALSRYEFEMSLQGQPEVEPVGSITHPKYDFISASPDGEIKALNKAIEIKCSISHSAYLKNSKEAIPARYIPQVQSQIWICNYESIDFITFFSDPDGRLKDEINIVNVKPDLEYIKKLEERCIEFWAEVQEMINQYEWIEGTRCNTNNTKPNFR